MSDKIKFKFFEELKRQRELMVQGFANSDKRFEEILHYMDKRFEQVDKRFDTLTKRIDRFMIWSFGLTITTTSLIIAFLKFNN